MNSFTEGRKPIHGEVQNTRQLMPRTVLLNTCESTICRFQHANQQPQEVDIKEAESISQLNKARTDKRCQFVV